MTIPLQVVFKNIKEVKSPPSIINIFNEIRLRQNLCIDHSFLFFAFFYTVIVLTCTSATTPGEAGAHTLIWPKVALSRSL